MTYQTLSTHLEDRILQVTLDRPESMNAFTVEMANELVTVFNDASTDDEVGCVIVTGAGKAFCAGMDLSVGGNVFGLDENMQPSLEELRAKYNEDDMVNGVRDTGGRVTLAIYECHKPVIGAINGAAVGIGATMTLGMDIRLLSEKARIGFVFGKIGVTPEACSTWFLPRIVGMQQALEWVYTADILTAEEALAGGLARSVHAPGDLLPAARALAAKIVNNRSPVAIALARQMMYRNSAAPSPRTAHEIDSLAMYYTSLGDGKEGVASFLEKRDPEFKGSANQMPPFFPWWESEQ
ncbi:MAG: crotonase/enoyl-CoA hydratase family protein [Pseudomonadales bacterium]|nr:crotonase/enoyl-CoA hydratase family protein [Pseudomonadales bacterium]MBO6564958.1 crotonase/enoyl-CoA hydratase family protein [Pseudomonadales bacterium]MBO6597083.1 crotonase/enoyl-CoA hydratase family protein [Pseudomonadales bacterium]MBO6823730.1 crotonase/enoyl-CoA hydratase family protein [Pseudomonadales bacterium]